MYSPGTEQVIGRKFKVGLGSIQNKSFGEKGTSGEEHSDARDHREKLLNALVQKAQPGWNKPPSL